MISLNDVSLCFSDTAAAHIIQISCHECFISFLVKRICSPCYQFILVSAPSSLYADCIWNEFWIQPVIWEGLGSVSQFDLFANLL